MICSVWSVSVITVYFFLSDPSWLILFTFCSCISFIHFLCLSLWSHIASSNVNPPLWSVVWIFWLMNCFLVEESARCLTDTLTCIVAAQQDVRNFYATLWDIAGMASGRGSARTQQLFFWLCGNSFASSCQHRGQDVNKTGTPSLYVVLTGRSCVVIVDILIWCVIKHFKYMADISTDKNRLPQIIAVEARAYVCVCVGDVWPLLSEPVFDVVTWCWESLL